MCMHVCARWYQSEVLNNFVQDMQRSQAQFSVCDYRYAVHAGSLGMNFWTATLTVLCCR